MVAILFILSHHCITWSWALSSVLHDYLLKLNTFKCYILVRFELHYAKTLQMKAENTLVYRLNPACTFTLGAFVDLGSFHMP